MPTTRRGPSGKYEMSPQKKLELMETPIGMPLPKGLILKITMYVVLLLLISPWVFIMIKNNSIGNMSQKVNDFYDDNFSCNSRTSQKSQNTSDLLGLKIPNF
jgi:hypothetical protein